jgi:hypothetical protein
VKINRVTRQTGGKNSFPLASLMFPSKSISISAQYVRPCWNISHIQV